MLEVLFNRHNRRIMKIFYVGDSTCAQNNITTFPQTDIGQGLELYVKKEIKIHNHAVGGTSTKSFIDQGRLDVIEREMHTGDFLFIQFGHNDEKEYDKNRYTTPFGTFKQNLKKFVDVARNVGAVPF